MLCVSVCVCSAFHRLRTHAHTNTHGHTHTHRLAQFVRRVNHVSLWDHGTTTLHLELEIGIEIRNWNQLVVYVFRRSSFVVRFRAEFRIGIEIPLTRVNGHEKKAKNTLRTLRYVGGESFSQVFLPTCLLVQGANWWSKKQQQPHQDGSLHLAKWTRWQVRALSLLFSLAKLLLAALIG